MIEVNGNYIAEDESVVLDELKQQLYSSGIKYFNKVIDTPNNLMTTCPFHKDGQERKPSFGILKTKHGKYEAGTCHCFTCGWTGTFDEMVSNVFGYDDGGLFGAKWLVRNFLSIQVNSRPSIDLSCMSRVENKPQTVEVATYITEDELDRYRKYHPYMWKRKMTPEVVDIFDIGYDDETQCITFPIRDVSGNTLFVARRSVNSKYFNYPSGVEKPIYGLYEYYRITNKPSTIYICESMIDAITLWTHGKVAMALNGLGTDLQFKQLNELPCRTFILATDNDEAGMKARERLKYKLRTKLIYEVELPKGRKDVNECDWDEIENFRLVFN